MSRNRTKVELKVYQLLKSRITRFVSMNAPFSGNTARFGAVRSFFSDIETG